MRKMIALVVLLGCAAQAAPEWKVTTSVDKMTDAKHVLLTTESVSGPKSTLTAACLGGKGDDFRLAILVPFVVNYRRVGSYYEARGMWRVDSDKAEALDFDVKKASPSVAEFPVIRKGREQWLRKWAGKSRLILQVPAYGRGVETIEFDLAGFDPAPLAACYKQ